MSATKRESGFSLVELLVVIAIIALLLSILMPTLSKVRESARGIVCQSLIRNYTFAHFQYFNQYGQLMPSSVQDADKNIFEPWFTFSEFRWFVDLPPLAQEYKVWHSGDIEPWKPSYPRKYICPSAKYAIKNPQDGLHPMARSYGLNAGVYGPAGKPVLNVKGSRVACMSDSLDWWFNYWGCDIYMTSGENWQGPFSNTAGAAAYRHSKRANISYWDGHSETINATYLKQQLHDWFYRE
jgi:prepilin-type N-terminal cleavage/methylation domain-containing protein/prepilin-type processing-associated H-X9-DG protein